MGLDVDNGLLGNFHLSWTGTRWFSNWCKEHELPYPFIGWVSGDNSGDQCDLGPDNEHTRLAREWCKALEEKHPEIAELGNELRAKKDMNLSAYLYPHNALGEGHTLSIEERSEEHTSELQSPCNLVCRLLLEKKNKNRSTLP